MICADILINHNNQRIRPRRISVLLMHMLAFQIRKKRTQTCLPTGRWI